MNVFAAIGNWFERRVVASWEREGMRRIEAERRRQVEEERWPADHDDTHRSGQLLQAARCYYLHAIGWTSPDGAPPVGFPWPARWWKPKGPIRDLERAGALCIAEMDRCRRAGQPVDEAGCLLGLCAKWLGVELQAAIARADAALESERLW